MNYNAVEPAVVKVQIMSVAAESDFREVHHMYEAVGHVITSYY